MRMRTPLVLAVAILGMSGCYRAHGVDTRTDGAVVAPDGRAADAITADTDEHFCASEATILRLGADERCATATLGPDAPSMRAEDVTGRRPRPLPPGRMVRIYNEGTTPVSVDFSMGPCPAGGCAMILARVLHGPGCGDAEIRACVWDHELCRAEIPTQPTVELLAVPLEPPGAPVTVTACRP
jgi:hypothetical protein